MEPNFSGYVSKANLECSDGRKIMTGAFKHQDGQKVPLVYQHNHDRIDQVMGHVILTDKPDGTWGDAYLNETASAVTAGELVKHGDIDKFSIWAKNLNERGANVLGGDIQEVSLVLAGANPGANISNVLMHAGLDEDDNIIIATGSLMHADGTEIVPEEPKKETPPAEEPKPEENPTEGDPTVAEVLDTLTDDQTKAVNSIIDDIVTEAVTEALAEEPNDIQHSDSSTKGTPKMSRNPFENAEGAPRIKSELKHDDMKNILNQAKANGGVASLKELVRSDTGRELMHADTYGVDNIEILFPDAQALMATPVFVDRRQEWVKVVMAGTNKSPFSRIKTFYADITADEARAKGYVKGEEKIEEVFPVLKRTTGPAMVYKLQKLDRQDIIDIVDFDVVAWMKVEMRGKLDEEIARAAIFGDGRSAMDRDKVQEPTGNSGDGIRSVLNDADLYASTFDVPLPANPVNTDWNILLDTAVESSEFYKGSGNITGFMSYRIASKLLTIRDEFGHRVYRNLDEVAGDMGFSKIVRVPTEFFDATLLCIALDLSDYNFGANRGGEVTMFDDFDIKFNQYEYLIETYLSGALVMPYSAQIYRSVASTATKITPLAPTVAANVITIPTQTGVVYKRTDTGATVAQGSTLTLNGTTLPTVEIEARPASGSYYFGDNLDEHDSWDFDYTA